METYAMVCGLLILLVATILDFPSVVAEVRAPALYVFGDSSVDAGNGRYIPTGSKTILELPYGIDFFNHTPTGRNCNGMTIADYIAIFLGLPLAPPYLSLSPEDKKHTLKGINYASGGSVIVPELQNETVITMDQQIEYFNRTVKDDLPESFGNGEELEKHLSRSIFFVSIGTNDHFQSYVNPLNPNGWWAHLSPNDFSWALLKQLSRRLQKLYQLGARKFLLNNVLPTGCFPRVRNKITNECNTTFNNFAERYSRRLPIVLQQLKDTTLPNAIISSANNFKFFAEVEKNGILRTGYSCWPLPNSTVCPDRENYFFWDEGNHPTGEANRLLSLRCFFHGSICTPFSVEELVKA